MFDRARLGEQHFDLFSHVSPSMVQPVEGSPKLCERGIASTAKCATIGPVQESFLASHGVNSTRASNCIFQRQTNGQAVLKIDYTVSEKASPGDELLPKPCG